jgi:hypothetical protein
VDDLLDRFAVTDWLRLIRRAGQLIEKAEFHRGTPRSLKRLVRRLTTDFPVRRSRTHI